MTQKVDEMDPGYGTHDLYKDRVDALLEQGLNRFQIAKELGVGNSTVYRWCVRWGYSVPVGGRKT